MSNAETADFLKIAVGDVERRVVELIGAGELHRRAGAVQGPSGRRGSKAWDALRPAIREMYEDHVPHKSIVFMLGITPIQLNTQLRRLFKEGLPRRQA